MSVFDIPGLWGRSTGCAEALTYVGVMLAYVGPLFGKQLRGDGATNHDRPLLRVDNDDDDGPLGPEGPERDGVRDDDDDGASDAMNGASGDAGAPSTSEAPAQISLPRICLPRCGDGVPDSGLDKIASEEWFGPGLTEMRGSSPPAMKPSSAKFAREDTLLVFDWDDTILCTTWLFVRKKLRLDEACQPTDEQRESVTELARAAAATLRAAKELGTVVIITNSERGWIERTCSKFLPALLPELEGVEVVSARTTFESQDSTRPTEWKLLAFERAILDFYGAGHSHRTDRPKNVLSFGDGPSERKAVMRAAAATPNCVSKSVKFVGRPSVGQIAQQHRLVQMSLERIVFHGGSLDLCLQCLT